jgi:hypothetical protein
MNSKIERILKNVDALFPDEMIEDVYFNTSDEKRSIIERKLCNLAEPIMKTYEMPFDEPLDYLIAFSNEIVIAREIINAVRNA